jgi:hypothetical protein
MTKDEALQALDEGKKVSHYLFDDDEWMELCHGLIVFEDGVNCTLEEFFNKDRQGEQWEDGYKIFQE